MPFKLAALKMSAYTVNHVLLYCGDKMLGRIGQLDLTVTQNSIFYFV